MFGTKSLTAACCALVMFTSSVDAAPKANKLPTIFVYDNNRTDCPAAHGTKFIDPSGGAWGLPCGWDTQSATYHWGPYENLDWNKCICDCNEQQQCDIATFTGDCYLKKGLAGEGFVYTGRDNDRTAINLKRSQQDGINV